MDENSESQETIIVLEASSDSFVSYSTDCEALKVQFGSGVVKLEHELGDGNLDRSLNCSFVASNTLTNQTAAFPVHVKVGGVRGAICFYMANPLFQTTKRNNVLIRFDRSRYESAVREMAPQGSPLFTDVSFSHPMILKADILTGQVQSIRYRLLSPQESFFAIDSASGVLRTQEGIDFEQVCYFNSNFN